MKSDRSMGFPFQLARGSNLPWLSLAVFALLVGIGWASRLGWLEAPNFKPVGALALFAGFYFRRLWMAWAAVAAMMLASDWSLGFYERPLLLSVYGSLALASLLGAAVQRSGRRQGVSRWGTWGRFTAASLMTSTLFYLVTNGVVWAQGNWYPSTAQGMVECYLAGLPFFRATLCSDLLFSQILLGGYAWAAGWVAMPAGNATPLQPQNR